MPLYTSSLAMQVSSLPVHEHLLAAATLEGLSNHSARYNPGLTMQLWAIQGLQAGGFLRRAEKP